MTREDIESLGWVWQITYDRDRTYKGTSPTKMAFEYGNVWADAKAGFLKFMPETSEIHIITVDPGYNADGPNHSTKFHGILHTKEELEDILVKIKF